MKTEKMLYLHPRIYSNTGGWHSLDVQKDNLYYTFCEAVQKDFMRAFIERINIYSEKPGNDC